MKIYPSNSIILAPLAGYTDVPYRRSCRRHNCYYAFTEMTDVGSLIYNKKTKRIFLDRDKNEEWLGVQIVGSKLEECKKAVDIINAYNFSVLDLNLGCPSQKVIKSGKGDALAGKPDLSAQMIEMMVKRSKFPVSAKIRIQDKEDPSKTIHLAKKIEEAGASAITIHGRIREDKYSGPCHTNIIKAVKENINIQVVANGGIMDKESYDGIRAESGCDTVMIARGAKGNPWIFETLSGKRNSPPDSYELYKEIKTHILETIEYYGETIGIKVSRKLFLDYLKGRGYPSTLREKVSRMKNTKEFKDLLEEVKKGPTEGYIMSLNKKGE